MHKRCSERMFIPVFLHYLFFFFRSSKFMDGESLEGKKYGQWPGD